jgi:hypothetical protein
VKSIIVELSKFYESAKKFVVIAIRMFQQPGSTPPRASWKRVSAASAFVLAVRQLIIGDHWGCLVLIAYALFIGIFAAITRS